MSESQARRPLAVSTLALYALPAFPLAALTLPLYLVVPTFWAEAMGVPLATVGAVMLAVRLFDAFNDPAIGWLADRHPRNNRRKAWLLAACLPLAAATLALFWPPAGAGATWLGVTAALLSIGYTAMVLPLSAWGAELSDDYDERSRLAAWREGFVVAGTIVATGLPFSIGWADPEGLHGLALTAIMVAILLPVATALAAWRVPEARPATASAGPRAALAAMRGNPYFLRLVTAFFVNSFANALPATLFLLFVALKLEAEAWRGPLLILYFLCSIVGIPLWLALSRRLSKHRAWCWAMLAACACFLPAVLLGPGDVVLFAIVCVLSGLCLGADLTLPASMQADVIETDRIRHEENRAALFFAVWALATKTALALAIGVAFPLLDAVGVEASGSGDSTAGGLAMLAFLYAGAPVALKLVAIALMWRFPLDAAALEGMRAGVTSSR